MEHSSANVTEIVETRKRNSGKILQNLFKKIEKILGEDESF